MQYIVSNFNTRLNHSFITVHPTYLSARRSINGFPYNGKRIGGDVKLVKKFPHQPKEVLVKVVPKSASQWTFQVAMFSDIDTIITIHVNNNYL
jgi:hypothetical protein